ncbi:MAG: gamma-glutamyl-gamma-aminobutyrate hydrolase family protein [Armatimonadetes bacterium]|nr:gamma-glutamyl-gamma-aminobutyrate hydrolase family protein [Armatimonadota bacterium]MDI9603341.1 gamma-glutamyl-gamma-aminobutyrate hydrolase family protein [Acidobacteriota bacterium]
MGREKPMIGLSLETPGPDQQGAGVSGGHYVPALTEAGGDVRLLPPAPPSDAMALVSEIDGLCLSGGGDMNPSHYGEALSPLADGIDDARDERELALMRAARGRGIPIFGICRGCQVINVGYGGSLYQDLATEAPFPTRKHNHKADDPDRFHSVRLDASHRVSRPAGAAEVVVNTHHHQAVARLGEGLKVIAWADDGVVEAIAHVEEPVLGVQWHPERLDPPDRWAIELFISMCEAIRA